MNKYARTLLIAGVCVAFFAGGAYFTIGGQAATNLEDAASLSRDNTFNGTVNAFKKGIKIGQQLIGGVTFFEGTIINSTTKSGKDNPVTIGDMARIDGSIFRIEEGGGNPLRLADTLMPSKSNSYSLGTSGKKWRDMHLSNDAKVGGNLQVDDDANVGKSLEVKKNATVDGDITQDRNKMGTAKAMLTVDSNGNIVRSAENVDDVNPTFVVARTATGTYAIDFNFQVDDRYISVSPQGSSTNPTAASGTVPQSDYVVVYIADVSTGTLTDQAFSIIVF